MTEHSHSTSLDGVLELVTNLAKRSSGGDYIFRGEPECYDRVSSSLYRQYSKVDTVGFNIEAIQRANIEEARKYSSATDDIEILTELQHYGGKTNLVDFSTDYLVALFFACDGSPERDGRVVLLRTPGRVDFRVIRPRNPANRVIAQKSVFVEPTKGYIVPDAFESIPKSLKQPALNYLRTRHGISTETIYNDLLGFIRIQDLHQSAYVEFYAGLTSMSEGEYQKAIEHYSKSIDLNPQMLRIYNNRGNAYSRMNDLDCAIEDYNKVLALEPNYAPAYNNRGSSYHDKGDLDRAIEDYNKALALQPDYAAAYANRGTAYYDKGDLERAIQDFNKALELEPGLASAYLGRANVYLETGEFDRAFQDYDSILVQEPDNAHAYCNRGRAYLAQGDVDRALKDLNKSLEFMPINAPAYFSRGIAWLHLSKWANAKSDLETAKNQGLDVLVGFQALYESTGNFEKVTGVKLPSDIESLLT